MSFVIPGLFKLASAPKNTGKVAVNETFTAGADVEGMKPQSRQN